MSRSRKRIAIATAAAVAVILLSIVVVGAALSRVGPAGDSGSDSSLATDQSTTEPNGPKAAAPQAATGGRSAESSGRSTGKQDAPGPLDRQVVSRGELSLTSDDPGKARGRVRTMLPRWDAIVSDESTTTDKPGHIGRVDMTLRIPTASYQDAVAALSQLGKVTGIDQTASDVTTKVVDTDARVRAMAAGVRRVEALLAKANDLGQVVSIESELTRRQADLDSLKSQQAALADQTSMATLSLTITRHATPAPPAPERHAGFIGGLKAGLDALGTSARVVLQIVGAVLPFAVLVALIGIPAWWLLRRRRGRAAVEA